MENRISHEGIITKIDNDNVEVKILSKSACASCNIKTACNMSEMQEKIITIPAPKDKKLSIGQDVVISIRLGQANRAVIFAYVIPVIILISIGSLIPYYFVLFLLKDRIKRKFEYEIH